MPPIIQKTSPNFTLGRSGLKPEIIVVHIMAGSLLGTDAHFANPASGVSAHYGVGFTGEIHQYVGEGDVAWHAGFVNSPTFLLFKPGVNPNKYSVGIECEGQDLAMSQEAQLNALVELIRAVATRWAIPLDRQHIIGHYEINSGKPNCPSPNRGIMDTIVAKAKTAPLDKNAIKAEIIRLLNQL